MPSPLLFALLLLLSLSRGGTSATGSEAPTPFFFVKTHKTGSSTVAALLRYGASRREGYHCFVPPVKLAGHVWSWEAPLFRQLLLSELGALQEEAGGNRSSSSVEGGDGRGTGVQRLRFNCWTVHAVLSPGLLAHAMEPAPLVVTSVRDPLRRLLSAWNHYRPNGTTSFQAWVTTVAKGRAVRSNGTTPTDGEDENEDPHVGFNAMTAQLLPGVVVDSSSSSSSPSSSSSSFAAVVERVRSGEWAAVVMERMEESLVVLQRRLGWDDDDVNDDGDKFDDGMQTTKGKEEEEEEKGENGEEGVPDFAFVPLNTARRGAMGGEYRREVAGLVRVDVDGALASSVSEAAEGVAGSSSSNVSAVVGALAWKDVRLYGAATAALDDALSSAALWLSGHGHDHGGTSSSASSSAGAVAAAARAVSAAKVEELRRGRRRLEEACGYERAGEENDNDDERAGAGEGIGSVVGCRERRWSDMDWADHMRTGRLAETTTSTISSSSSSSSTAAAAAAAAALGALSLEADCRLLLPAESAEESPSSFSSSSSFPCVAAHYERPHGVASLFGGTFGPFGGSGPRGPGGAAQGGGEVSFRVPAASLCSGAAETLTDGCGAGGDAESGGRGAVRVVKRGGCSFARKASAAQREGFAALLIVDTTTAAPAPAPTATTTTAASSFSDGNDNDAVVLAPPMIATPLRSEEAAAEDKEGSASLAIAIPVFMTTPLATAAMAAVVQLTMRPQRLEVVSGGGDVAGSGSAANSAGVLLLGDLDVVSLIDMLDEDAARRIANGIAEQLHEAEGNAGRASHGRLAT